MKAPPQLFRPQSGQRPSLEFRPLADLNIDPSYQRSIEDGASNALIKRIATNWDWSLCQPLAVARRVDGSLFVIDGQHRLAAARVRKDIYDLPCVIMAADSCQQEASTFVKLNQQRRPLSQVALHRAAVASGDPEAQAIAAALANAGMSVATSTNPERWDVAQVSNIGGLQRCIRTHGEKILRPALEALANGFHGQVLRFAGTLFPGIAAVVADIMTGPAGDRAEQLVLLEQVIGGASQSEWRDEIVKQLGTEVNDLRSAAAIIFRAAFAEAREA